MIVALDYDAIRADTGRQVARGYATRAELLHATKALRDDSAELEFADPTCNLRDIDLGITVGSAATAAIHSITATPASP